MIRIVEIADIVDACAYKPGWRIYLRARAESAHSDLYRFILELTKRSTA